MARFSLADAVSQTQTAIQSVFPAARVVSVVDRDEYVAQDNGKPKTSRHGQVVIDLGDQTTLAARSSTASAFWCLKVLRDNPGLLLLAPAGKTIELQSVQIDRSTPPPAPLEQGPKRRVRK